MECSHRPALQYRTIKDWKKETGINMEMIRAVFVTHDHADHIKSLMIWRLGENWIFLLQTRIPWGASTGAIAWQKSYIRLSVTWKSSNPCSWKIFISDLSGYLMMARTMWAVHWDRRKSVCFSYRPWWNYSYDAEYIRRPFSVGDSDLNLSV